MDIKLPQKSLDKRGKIYHPLVMTCIIVIVLLAFVYLWAALIGWMHDTNRNFSNWLWEKGECRGWLAKRNRITGSVFFIVFDEFHNEHCYRFRLRFWSEFELNESKTLKTPSN
jgi:hypothetical protein